MNKDLGQVMTPKLFASKMVSLVQNTGSVLDPAAGQGVFLELIPHAIGIEIDASIVRPHIADRITISDFFDTTGKFDTIIGNPPYIKGKHTNITYFGGASFNLYMQFIAKAVDMLNPQGELIFVVPYGLFVNTSGGQLLTWMLKHGTFSYIEMIDHTIEWDAAVEVCLFRYVKNVFVTKHNLHSSGGFVFATPFSPVAVLDDFFSFRVGAAIRQSDIIDQTDNTVEVLAFDKTYHVRKGKWPRNMKPVTGTRILMHAGPTRRLDVFRVGTAPIFTCHALTPKHPMHLEQATQALNTWQYWSAMLVRHNGRWNPGLSRLSCMPIDDTLTTKLIAAQM